MWGVMNIACLNINGLRDLSKFERVKRLSKAEVLCLQETHWTTDIMDDIKKRWEGGHFCESRKCKSLWGGDFDKKG